MAELNAKSGFVDKVQKSNQGRLYKHPPHWQIYYTLNTCQGLGEVLKVQYLIRHTVCVLIVYLADEKDTTQKEIAVNFVKSTKKKMMSCDRANS